MNNFKGTIKLTWRRPSRLFSVGGLAQTEQYVLAQEPNKKWGVYYSERGQKTGLRLFDSESSACFFFLDKIIRDLGIGRK